jgi:hypothetical protein
MNAIVQLAPELITVAREAYSDELFEELLPLAQRCWDEGTFEKGMSCAGAVDRQIAIEPDRDVYRQLDSLGRFVMVTLRAAGTLIGYAEGFLYPSPHHKRILCCNVDSAYVEVAYRGHTLALMWRFEAELRALGVHMVGWQVHANGHIHKLLKTRGYSADDLIMEKRLCAL